MKNKKLKWCKDNLLIWLLVNSNEKLGRNRIKKHKFCKWHTLPYTCISAMHGQGLWHNAFNLWSIETYNIHVL